MIRRHPILGGVLIALVLVGIAIVIGLTTGDDSNDAASADELAADELYSAYNLARSSATTAGTAPQRQAVDEVVVRFELGEFKPDVRVTLKPEPARCINVQPSSLRLSSHDVGELHFSPEDRSCGAVQGFRVTGILTGSASGRFDLAVRRSGRTDLLGTSCPDTGSVFCVVDNPSPSNRVVVAVKFDPG